MSPGRTCGSALHQLKIIDYHKPEFDILRQLALMSATVTVGLSSTNILILLIAAAAVMIFSQSDAPILPS